MAERSKLGLGCTLLFLLPFCAVGTGMTVAAVGQAMAGHMAQAGFFAIFALTFGGLGFGAMVLALRGSRAIRRREALEAASPDQPWRWREDWAAGRIHDSNRGGMFLLWVFAGFWNLVSLPAGVFAVAEALRTGNRVVLLALVFPLIGAGLLVAAIRSTARFLKYGTSVLELSSNPGVVGGKLSGVLLCGGALFPEAGFQLTLSCLRRVTSGTGKNRSTSESVLWQDEATAHPGLRAEGTTVPFSFAIPASVEPTAGSPSDGIVWRLAATAEVPGVDYRASFEVPVFRTADSAAISGPGWSFPPPAPDLEDFRQPSSSRIAVTTNRRGTEIRFPAGRNLVPGLFVTGFFLVWTAMIWLMVVLKAPILFPIAFGVADLLLFYGMLHQWFGSSTVQADRGELVITSGLPGLATERRLDGRQVSAIEPAIGMQAGSTVYYDLVVRLEDGKTVRAGRGIRHKREAEWLAGLILQALKGSSGI